MFKQSVAVIFAVAALGGCTSTTLQNPVDFATYRNEPLVKQVDDGMTEQQVLTIGGEPSARMHRRAHPGTCNNYILNKDGHQQAYYVSFNSNDRVDNKGFMTCEQHEANEKAM
jgi:osmotically inducible lipoprotein OsmE